MCSDCKCLTSIQTNYPLEVIFLGVMNKGVINLVDVLTFLPNLSKIHLDAEMCGGGVTDRSAEKIAGFLASTNTTLNQITIFLGRTGVTQNGVNKIRAIQSPRFSTFDIRL
eukprot:TRINITY_DN9430_c0_g3_i1.p1 TRINITY_DN9430_c0_g3~~TRINITY_DN9430_c0_g3_i1.p1  ORF type:complete len:111 (+),score=10.92 TRINITY_DN9430_c0_g3_i1:139-471(+)